MPEAQSRKLAAILAADIAGYSALMGVDEARTVRDLKGHRAVVLPLIGEFGGRIIDTAGDGFLAEFGSIVNAVECAVAIQKLMAQRNAEISPDQRMQFRIGINIGDIIADEASIYGDGINIAARLESIAEPGGILLSRQAHDQVEGKLPLRFQKLGPRTLKNIARPIEVVAIDIAPTAKSERPAGAATIVPLHPPAPRAVTDVAARQSGPLRAWMVFVLAPIIALLLAHYLMIMKLDLNPVYLRSFSLLLAAGIGVALPLRTGYGTGAACLAGAAVGLLSVFGMLAVVGLTDSTAIIPTTLLEWQEAVEYAAGITLATVFGTAIARLGGRAVAAISGYR
jgi:class 3 adenylate cyclase